MRVDRMLMAALALAVVCAAPAALAAPDPAGADEAFDAGDTQRALSLYDEILATSPDDVHALLRSGMLLSWDRKYDEALARYARGLSVEPGNAQLELERAKVLLWSRRYDEARPAFGAVLAGNPREPWALNGMAQSYAWSGQSARAIPWYEQALAAEPGMKEAQTGLAYAQLETGNTSAAEKNAKELKARFPDDKEVDELARAVKKARAPWISIGFDHIDDSDDNRMNTTRLEGGLGLQRSFDLRFGLAYAGMSGPVPASADAAGTAESIYAVAGWQPGPGRRGELRAGASRLTDSTGGTRTTGIGGLSATFPMSTWSGRAGISRDPFLYSPGILDSAVDVTSLWFGASGSAGKRFKIETNAAYGDLSDGNDRVGLDAAAWYVFKFEKQELRLGPAVRFLDYAQDLDNGYFDPSGLVALMASLRSEGSIGGSVWAYEGLAEAGAQSYTHDGAKSSHRPLANIYGSVSRPLPHGIGLALYAGWGNSSTAGGPGFHSINLGARLRFTIGG